MSVVIAIKDTKNNRVVLGCDSQVTEGQQKYKLTGSCSKINSYPEYPSIIIGGVGSLRDLQLIQCNSDIIDAKAYITNNINYNWCVENLFKNIYNLLLNKNRIDKDKNGTPISEISSNFILAINNQAFQLGNDGAILELDDYLVIGSGARVAIGVLENTKNMLPEQRIREAIRACSDTTIYVDNNVILAYTKEVKSDKTIKK